tara:strand:+ start:316 stop:630 length:315 start_codon:yes stop_codon:yes gene_type:complete
MSPAVEKGTMAKREYSKYQQGVIRRYYENREQIDESKLSELVTSLYLAESATQREKLWTRVEDLLARLEVLPGRIEHVMEQRDATVLAELVSDLQKGEGRRRSG